MKCVKDFNLRYESKILIFVYAVEYVTVSDGHGKARRGDFEPGDLLTGGEYSYFVSEGDKRENIEDEST